MYLIVKYVIMQLRGFIHDLFAYLLKAMHSPDNAFYCAPFKFAYVSLPYHAAYFYVACWHL